MNEPFLSFRSVSNTYTSRPLGIIGKKEKKPVLTNVSFEIEQGEIFGLVGESGCGKTTLAKCILGLIDYEGEIFINGRKREARPSFAERRLRTEGRSAFEVQAVFQNPSSSLNPVKTIDWILEEPLRAHRLCNETEREKRVDEILDLVGLDSSYKKRRPAELSSGQKQRVAIGFALMLKPGLIVADEPVSALDVSVAAQVLNLFRDLNKRFGLTLLFISHNMEVVHYICNKVAIMQNGGISDVYSLPNVLQAPCLLH
jgi:ABC-type glutathione transport system ATPase component